ncbi:MAG: outer membrane protein assembly factor BamB [Verrucomicrobiales bacterium]|jgi:outer membrane protein assembly factor BamB
MSQPAFSTTTRMPPLKIIAPREGSAQTLYMRTILFSIFFVFSVSASAQTSKALRALIDEQGVSGGLLAHAACGDGMLMQELAKAYPAFIVHGLERDLKVVMQARERFRTLATAERLSVEHWQDQALPYADNLVNVLIAPSTDLDVDEAMRVLAPGGMLVYARDGEWMSTVKTRDSRGEWTHYQFDASNNMVGDDTACGLPRRFQWSGTPLWSTSHENMSSLNAMVSANERVFYIIDEGPRASVQLPADWQLVARDAHNGVVLWKKPMKQWLTRFWPWKSGPAQMPRKLVAVDDHVYAPLDINGPVIQFDAATGKELQVYEGSGAAEEFICVDGTLLVQVNPDPSNMLELEAERRKRRHFSYDSRNRVLIDHEKAKRIVAYDAASGKQLWSHVGPKVSPLSLGALGDKVAYHDGECVVVLDLKSGDELWKSEPIKERMTMNAEEAPTLVLHPEAIFFAWNKKVTALSMADGKTLWKSSWVANDYRSPVSVMLMNDLVWSMDIVQARGKGTFTGRDRLSGEVKKQFDLPPFQGIGHHRCYKAKASGDFVLLSRSGVEYVDPSKESYDEHHWIRGACLYGIMPANGLLYSTPHACACYIKGKLNGFTAMAPGPTAPAKAEADSIEKGPAFDGPLVDRAREDDWPTYRHDMGRSGWTSAQVDPDLGQLWRTPIGGELTSLTVGSGRVLVAQKNRNTVQALSSESGVPAWQFCAGAQVDSPPTIHEGRVYFGSADGYVYAVNADDGALAWRSRAAPSERRVMSFGRLESAWPVHGSVLVKGGAVFCAAGRSSFLDGGIRMLKMDAETGKILIAYTIYDLDDSGKQPPLEGSFDMAGALTDILSSDGGSVFMRHMRFETEILKPQDPAPHLFSPTGYLDDNWWHRTSWVYGSNTKGGYGGWWQEANKLPAGRLMVFDDETVYSFGRSFYAGMNSAQFGRGEKYILYASDKKEGPEPDWAGVNAERRRKGDLGIDWKKYRTTPIQWQQEIPIHVRAMVLANRTLFAAGPYGDAVRSMDAFEGKRGVRLSAFSAKDGKAVSSYELDALPVFDGLVAANGRLFLAMEDGSVRSFGADGTALVSKLGEAVEVLPEVLLASDEEYIKEIRLARGDPIKGPGPGAGNRKVPGKNLNGSFSQVLGGKVVEGPLGYRLAAGQDKLAFALHELKTPITDQATWRFKMQPSPGYPNPPNYQNGFLVFGDGVQDDKLVKCGIQFVRGIAVIREGRTTAQKGLKQELKGDLAAVFEVEVTVDLSQQKVVMKIGEATMSMPIQRKLTSITRVGFAGWNAVTDFSLLEGPQ